MRSCLSEPLSFKALRTFNAFWETSDNFPTAHTAWRYRSLDNNHLNNYEETSCPLESSTRVEENKITTNDRRASLSRFSKLLTSSSRHFNSSFSSSLVRAVQLFTPQSNVTMTSQAHRFADFELAFIKKARRTSRKLTGPLKIFARGKSSGIGGDSSASASFLR